MEPLLARARPFVAALWRADAPLTGAGFLLLGALAAFLLGLWADPRTITGMPAWMKPAKFAVSTAIYTLTLAWIFSYLPAWTRTRRIVGRTTAIVLVLEVAIIAAQAWRGTTSHFNVGTQLDGALFTVMGIAIVLQTFMSIAVVVALWRQPFADQALGWALRLGLSITIVGAMSGGLMTRPTNAQLEQARVTRRMPIAGAHTVGAPDGGPGLPATGWSREHGDLRVPHFLGLHAVQVLPSLAVVFRRRSWTERTRVRLVAMAAASYVLLFGILLSQALRGQSVTAPDVVTVASLAAWFVFTAGSWMAAAHLRGRVRHAAAHGGTQ